MRHNLVVKGPHSMEGSPHEPRRCGSRTSSVSTRCPPHRASRAVLLTAVSTWDCFWGLFSLSHLPSSSPSSIHSNSRMIVPMHAVRLPAGCHHHTAIPSACIPHFPVSRYLRKAVSCAVFPLGFLSHRGFLSHLLTVCAIVTPW